MSEAQMRSSGARRQQQPSRLQRRAPSSIQVSPVSNWNVAIPLLSPLDASPKTHDWPPGPEISNSSQRRQSQAAVKEPEKAVVFKKWQHPAAPFCYETAPFAGFACNRTVDRT